MAIFEEKDCLTSVDKVGKIVIKEGVLQDVLYTFCIPTYKRSQDLMEALDSVYAQQTDIPFNVIVSDNNQERDDETEKLINTYYSNKDNLVYFKNAENLGMAGNWNRLILECKTKYMVLFHDDDVLAPFFLQKMDEVASRYPDVAALNCGKCIWYGDDNFKYHNSRLILKHDAKTNFFRFIFGAPSGCLFSVEKARMIGGFDPDCFPSLDYVFVEKMCLANMIVMTIESELMKYRMGTNTSVKLATQEGFVKDDWRIKQELSEILNINPIIKKIAIYFEIKLHLRTAYKLGGSKEYMGYTAGSKLFIVLLVVYIKILKVFIAHRYRVSDN